MKIKLLFKDHKIGYDLWLNKKHLFEDYFTSFYEFIKNNNGKNDLEKHNINCAKDFIEFASWNAGGMENCYAMGFAFHKYYADVYEGADITKQTNNSFIGYCYQNDKYRDFFEFLITFFAWWRNDEGCTRFDPYNHADEAFNSSWALLVDTCKLFYLTSETVYHWQSFRVKYALDNIPGLILSNFDPDTTYEALPKVRVSGYEFMGYTDEDGNIIDNNNYTNQEVLYINLKRKDFYNYWGKEEPKLNKVYTKDYKKADPA